MTLLELGPGTIPHPRITWGIDLHHPVNLSAMSAIDPWPLEDNSVDEIVSSHFMEHIAKGEPIIHVMSEALRVLRPGGTFTSVHPAVGYTDAAGSGHLVNGWQPWSDPTHVQFWWIPESYLYFCEGNFSANADYGLPIWSPLGPQISEEEASQRLQEQQYAPAIASSFWAIRGGWECVVRLIKP